MRKKVFVGYSCSSEIVEIKIKDYSGRCLEKFKFNGNNSEIYGAVINRIFRKYGFKPEIGKKESVQFKEDVRKVEEEDMFGF